MRNILLFLLIGGCIASCKDRSSSRSGKSTPDFDLFDAAYLRMDSIPLVGDAGSFLRSAGLPNRMMKGVEEFTVNSDEELDSILSNNPSSKETKFFYPGLVFLLNKEHQIVPYSIDLRKTVRPVTYGKQILDTFYTIQQFAVDFPSSFRASYVPPESLFAIETLESGSGLKHFAMMGQAGGTTWPLVEWTFRNDRLIYIICSGE